MMRALEGNLYLRIILHRVSVAGTDQITAEDESGGLSSLRTCINGPS